MFPHLFNNSIQNRTSANATSFMDEFTSVAQTEPLDSEDFVAPQISRWFGSGETSTLSYAQQLQPYAYNADLIQPGIYDYQAMGADIISNAHPTSGPSWTPGSQDFEGQPAGAPEGLQYVPYIALGSLQPTSAYADNTYYHDYLSPSLQYQRATNSQSHEQGQVPLQHGYMYVDATASESTTLATSFPPAWRGGYRSYPTESHGMATPAASTFHPHYQQSQEMPEVEPSTSRIGPVEYYHTSTTTTFSSDQAGGGVEQAMEAGNRGEVDQGQYRSAEAGEGHGRSMKSTDLEGSLNWKNIEAYLQKRGMSHSFQHEPMECGIHHGCGSPQQYNTTSGGQTGSLAVANETQSKENDEPQQKGCKTSAKALARLKQDRKSTNGFIDTIRKSISKSASASRCKLLADALGRLGCQKPRPPKVLTCKKESDRKVRKKLNNREIRRFLREGFSIVVQRQPADQANRRPGGSKKMTRVQEWEYLANLLEKEKDKSDET